MSYRINLIGQRYGRLTVQSYAGQDKQRKSTWHCTCICGSQVTVTGSHLRSGDTRSCGCYRLEVAVLNGKASVKHGQARKGQETPEYKTWRCMIDRCTNPNAPNYRYYGARGIAVCRRWRESFQNFFADMGQRPSRSYSIHRLRNSRGYSPSNCAWASPLEQAHHKRTLKLTRAKVDALRASYNSGGIKQAELAEKYGIAPATVSQVITGARWPNLPPKKPSASVTQAERRAA